MTRNLERRSKRKFQRMECNKIYDKRMIKIQNYRIKLLSVTIELSFSINSFVQFFYNPFS